MITGASLQFMVVILATAAAVTYAVWRVYEALKPDNDPCKHCELKKNCKKFCQSKEK